MNENNAWLLLGLAAVLTGIAGAAIVVDELSKQSESYAMDN